MSLQSVLAELEKDVDDAGKFVEGTFVGLFKAEVTNAVQAVGQVMPTFESDIVTAASTGQLANVGSVLGHVFSAAATQLAASSTIVGVQSLGAAVAAAIAAHPAVAAMPTQVAAAAATAPAPAATAAQ